MPSFSIHGYGYPLLPTFDHKNVVSLARLDLAVLGIARGAGLELVSDLFEVGHETSSRLPAERTACRDLVVSPALDERHVCRSPCLALSSENSRATSSNLEPSRSLASASSFLECFSQRMWRTLMLVAGLSFPGPLSPESLPPALPLPLGAIAMVVDGVEAEVELENGQAGGWNGGAAGARALSVRAGSSTVRRHHLRHSLARLHYACIRP